MSPNNSILLVFLSCTAGAACSGPAHDTASPQTTLAASFRAQEALRAIEARWKAATPQERRLLEPTIRRELRLHSNDPSATILRHYLAWILLQRGDIAGAEQLLTVAQKGSGTARDFARALQAGVWLKRGQAARALAELQVVHRILIDADQRAMCDQLLVEAALQRKQIVVATQTMLDLLLYAPAAQQEAMRQQIKAWFAGAPAADLEDAYTHLAREAAPSDVNKRDRARAVTFMLTLIRRRLTDSALQQADAELAQRLLDHYVPSGDTEALAHLAATGELPARVLGRAMGLILEVGTPLHSQRSAEVATGLSQALGLLADQGLHDEMVLKTRTASDDSASIKLAFEQLVSDGVAVMVAGVSDRAVTLAVDLAEQTRMPTLILGRPASISHNRRAAFLMGDSTERAQVTLTAWASAQKLAPLAVVGEHDPGCSDNAGSVGGFTFPVGEWKKSRLQALLMLGPERCLSTLLDELRRVQCSPAVLLGLDVAHRVQSTPRAVAISAGHFPAGMAAGVSESSTPGSWYQALGHDAALFGSFATRDFEAVMTNQPEEVELLHQKVAHALRNARITDLWTTRQQGFSKDLVLERDLQVLSPSAP